MHMDRMHHMLRAALAAGATRHSASSWEWDISGRCHSPIPRELRARPARRWVKGKNALAATKANQIVREIMQQFPGAEILSTNIGPQPGGWEKYVTVKPGSQHTQHMLLHVKCRKCPACLAERRRLWELRALRETMAAPRTWFGTITLNQTAQFAALTRAQARSTRRGIVFEALTTQQRFAAVHYQISGELTKYLKRVRKESGAPLRFLLVAEAHASGQPHYHALVHEVDRDRAVTKRTLDDQWKLGFTRWRLVDQHVPGEPEIGKARPARYVCKYLGKSAMARVRASLKYGETTPYGFSEA